MTGDQPVERPPFSDELEAWLSGDGPKTLGALLDVFEERSVAVAVLVLMIVPALPLPTGGVTHVFEVIAALLALQLVLGRRTVWLPTRWRERVLGEATTGRAIPFIVRRVRWFERFSRPRGSRLLARRPVRRLLGLVLLAFAVTAGLAPPFSGLDTLPALGAAVVALGIILEDVVVIAVGGAIGVSGALLILTVGAALVRWLRGLF